MLPNYEKNAQHPGETGWWKTAPGDSPLLPPFLGVFLGARHVKNLSSLSLFQNPVGFGTSSWKNRPKPGFSPKFKGTVPKAEVLEQPPLRSSLKTRGNSSGLFVQFLYFLVD
jgi:hypothetical protein